VSAVTIEWLGHESRQSAHAAVRSGGRQTAALSSGTQLASLFLMRLVAPFFRGRLSAESRYLRGTALKHFQLNT